MGVMPSATLFLLLLGVKVVAVAAGQVPSFGGHGTCIGWGGSGNEIRTFDGMRFTYDSSGVHYLVKHPAISIQAKYEVTNEHAVTKKIVISGVALRGNRLAIGPSTATWNGAPILSELGSVFSQPGLLTVEYDTTGALIDTHGGVDASNKKIVHVKIDDGSPEGISIQVNRWTESAGDAYINWKIDMHSRLGQRGHCGNFNGNSADDGHPKGRQLRGNSHFV